MILRYIILLSILTSPIFAQERSNYIGGMVGYSSTKSTYDSNASITSKEWNFSPEVGVWLYEDVQTGLIVNLSGSDDGIQKTVNTFSPGAYVRKWHDLSDLFHVYAGFNATFITSKTEITGQFPSKSREKGIGAFIDFGASLNINEKWRIVGRYATLGYEFVKNLEKQSKTDSFGFNVDTLGNPFNVGLYYTFRQ